MRERAPLPARSAVLKLTGMDVSAAIVLGVWGAFAASVILRLRREQSSAFDDRFTPRDQRLVGAVAFYLAVPPLVLLAQLAQLAVLHSMGGRAARFESWVYWGAVEPAQPEQLAPLAHAGVAAAGPVALVIFALVLIGWTLRARSNASQNHLRLETARLLLVLAFGIQPVLSIVASRGAFFAVREALNQRSDMSGDLALLGWGILGAYAFWKWRSAHGLRLMATPLHDEARLASGALAESPDDPEALRTLGAAQLAAGDPAALETLAHAHSVSPNDPQTELLLGRVHLERGEARTAADHLRHAGTLLEDHPDEDEGLLFEVTLALSAARIALGDPEGAILTAEAAREAAPADPRGLLMIADALVAGGRVDDARARLEGALGASEGPLRREIEQRLSALRRRG